MNYCLANMNENPMRKTRKKPVALPGKRGPRQGARP